MSYAILRGDIVPANAPFSLTPYFERDVKFPVRHPATAETEETWGPDLEDRVEGGRWPRRHILAGERGPAGHQLVINGKLSPVIYRSREAAEIAVDKIYARDPEVSVSIAELSEEPAPETPAEIPPEFHAGFFAFRQVS